MNHSQRLLIASLIAFLALVPTTWAQDRAPQIGYIYPAGGRQGTTFEVTVGGRFLHLWADPVNRVYVTGNGIKAEVVRIVKAMPEQDLNNLQKKARQLMKNKPDAQARKEIAEIKRTFSRTMSARFLLETYPAIAEAVVVRVTLAADAEPGPRELRLESRAGISRPFRFYVGQLPEFQKGEPEVVVPVADFDTPTYPRPVPTSITLPAVVNGQIIPYSPDTFYYQPERFTPGAADRYSFQARKGQQLVIAAGARELNPYIADAVPGWFQATLALYDARGKELAFNDDYRFHPDPVLLFKVPEDGQYTIEIKDALSRGRPDFVYRITIGELPFLTGIFPLGGPAGGPATGKLFGFNLPAETLTIDTKDKQPGKLPIFVRREGLLSNTIPFAVDTLPECSEKEPNDSLQAAQTITLPTIVNGRIDRPGDWDVFRFTGRAGQRIIAEVMARRLESPLDSVLELCDATGRRLAFNDDHEDKGDGLQTHHADSLIDFTLPADGTYYLRLGDAQHHGGQEYAYRLRLSEPRPDFELRVGPSCINGQSWRITRFTVWALRKDGFSGPIALALKDTPGVAIQGAAIPEGQDQVRLTLAFAPQIAEPIPLCLEGRALIDGQEVVRRAVPADDLMQAFFYRHQVPAADLKLVPLDRPQVSKKDGRRPAVPADFQSSWAVLSEQPVKIPAGGVAEVQVRMGGAPKGEHSVELSDPPPGISVDRVSWTQQNLTVVLRSEAEKAGPGLKGNLIGSAVSRNMVTGKDGKTREVRSEGPMPAISFEVIAPSAKERSGK